MRVTTSAPSRESRRSAWRARRGPGPSRSVQPWIATSRTRASSPTATRPGVHRGELVDERRRLDRRATDHNPMDTRREPAARILDGAHTASTLDARRHRGADRFDRAEVRVAAVAGRIEIDHVDPARTRVGEAARYRDRGSRRRPSRRRSLPRSSRTTRPPSTSIDGKAPSSCSARFDEVTE